MLALVANSQTQIKFKNKPEKQKEKKKVFMSNRRAFLKDG